MLVAKVMLAMVAATCFVSLGVLSMIQQEWRVGVASFALGLANGLLLA